MGLQAEKGYGGFLTELKRCEQLGLTMYNFHPGSTTGELGQSQILEISFLGLRTSSWLKNPDLERAEEGLGI